MKKYLLPLLLLIASEAFSQSISGKITNKETGETLPFTNVVIDGRNQGTVSNSEGVYLLDIQELATDQKILFSFVGFETRRLSISELQKGPNVTLNPATIRLGAVSVHSKELTADDIIEKVQDNYEKNHPKPSESQTVFYHKYERTPWTDDNQIKVRSSDFPGLDKSTFKELFDMLPNEFVEYQDAIVRLNTLPESQKIEPLEAISLEEQSMQGLQEKMEKKMSTLLSDIENSQKNPDIYYKFRSGIFAGKMEEEEDDNETEHKIDSADLARKKDSLHYYISTKSINGAIKELLSNYAHLDSKYWEFITSPGKYKYNLEDYTIYNDELVYNLSFKPKNRGLFKGNLLISTESYALLQVSYVFAPDKQDEKIQLLGVGHAVNNVECRVMYEKIDSAYFVKYINAEKQESASIERNFSIMKKEKRFLIDKELNEIKMSAELYFDINSQWELLVINREPLTESQLEKVQEPEFVKFKKQYANTPEMWTTRSVIAPSSELKKYKRSGEME